MTQDKEILSGPPQTPEGKYYEDEIRPLLEKVEALCAAKGVPFIYSIGLWDTTKPPASLSHVPSAVSTQGRDKDVVHLAMTLMDNLPIKVASVAVNAGDTAEGIANAMHEAMMNGCGSMAPPKNWPEVRDEATARLADMEANAGDSPIRWKCIAEGKKLLATATKSHEAAKAAGICKCTECVAEGVQPVAMTPEEAAKSQATIDECKTEASKAITEMFKAMTPDKDTKSN